MSETKGKAILSLRPKGGFSVTEDGVVTYFKSGGIEPSESAIQAEMTRLQSIEDAQLYARNRRKEYPSNGDQWDMIYKDNLNSTTTHKDAVEAVKTKWPKNNTGPVE